MLIPKNKWIESLVSWCFLGGGSSGFTLGLPLEELLGWVGLRTSLALNGVFAQHWGLNGVVGLAFKFEAISEVDLRPAAGIEEAVCAGPHSRASHNNAVVQVGHDWVRGAVK